VDARYLKDLEHNVFLIDKKELFSKELTLNPLKLPCVDVGGDRLVIIEKLIIYNTSCPSDIK